MRSGIGIYAMVGCFPPSCKRRRECQTIRPASPHESPHQKFLARWPAQRIDHLVTLAGNDQFSESLARAGWTAQLHRQFMPKPKSAAFARIRAEVIRLVGWIPPGKFTTYGTIAVHMNVGARHVAFVMSRLTAEESAALPWHRVVSADGRLSPKMDPELSRVQRGRLESEGMKIDTKGFIVNPDAHFHFVGPRRSIRWSHVAGAGQGPAQ